jgi:sodium-dependent dicarboxylate transporter 2/3/5
MEKTISDSLLIALMFGSGFLLSRVFIKCGIAETLVYAFMRRSKGHISRIILYIIVLSSFISMVIPNIIAILTILPLLEVLKKDIEKVDDQKHSLTTALAMANLYGSNIGGVGFMIGSAANIVLLTFLYLNRVEGTAKINFLSWLGWGAPFVLVLSSIAALIIIVFLIPKRLKGATLDFTNMHRNKKDFPHQRVAVVLSAAFFVVWITLSAVHILDKHYNFPYILGIGAVYFVGFNYLAFFVDYHDKKLNIKSRLLYAPDVASNLPAKGFILATASIVFATLLLLFDLDRKVLDLLGVTTLLNNVAMQTRALVIVSVILTTFTIFISEVLSNMATAVAFFTVAVALCKSLGVPALPILIGISIVATVPSMSPIASPVNAMAFGGIKGVSLRRMITVGFVMNLAAIAVVNLWALLYIPWYYRIRL